MPAQRAEQYAEALIRSPRPAAKLRTSLTAANSRGAPRCRSPDLGISLIAASQIVRVAIVDSSARWGNKRSVEVYISDQM